MLFLFKPEQQTEKEPEVKQKGGEKSATFEQFITSSAASALIKEGMKDGHTRYGMTELMRQLHISDKVKSDEQGIKIAKGILKDLKGGKALTSKFAAFKIATEKGLKMLKSP